MELSGTWEMSSPGRGGEMMIQDITIVQEGSKIKVTAESSIREDRSYAPPTQGIRCMLTSMGIVR
jgi:hypothetical protein